MMTSQENEKSLNNRAYCYAKLSNFKKSIEDYSKALKIDSSNIHSLHNRGICYEKIGQYKKVCLF